MRLILKTEEQGTCFYDGAILIGTVPAREGCADRFEECRQDESAGVTLGCSRPSEWLVAWPTAFRLEVLRKEQGY